MCNVYVAYAFRRFIFAQLCDQYKNVQYEIYTYSALNTQMRLSRKRTVGHQTNDITTPMTTTFLAFLPFANQSASDVTHYLNACRGRILI